MHAIQHYRNAKLPLGMADISTFFAYCNVRLSYCIVQERGVLALKRLPVAVTCFWQAFEASRLIVLCFQDRMAVHVAAVQISFLLSAFCVLALQVD